MDNRPELAVLRQQIFNRYKRRIIYTMVTGPDAKPNTVCRCDFYESCTPTSIWQDLGKMAPGHLFSIRVRESDKQVELELCRSADDHIIKLTPPVHKKKKSS